MCGGEFVDNLATFFAADVGLFNQKPLHGGSGQTFVPKTDNGVEAKNFLCAQQVITEMPHGLRAVSLCPRHVDGQADEKPAHFVFLANRGQLAGVFGESGARQGFKRRGNGKVVAGQRQTQRFFAMVHAQKPCSGGQFSLQFFYCDNRHARFFR